MALHGLFIFVQNFVPVISSGGGLWGPQRRKDEATGIRTVWTALERWVTWVGEKGNSLT